MKPRKRPVKIPTDESLANAALFYLSRFAASENSLRRVLMKKLYRASLVHTDFAKDEQRQSALREAIERIIARHKKSGVISDEAFAEMKVSSLRRAGRSRRYIQNTLAQKTGIKADVITRALDQKDGDTDPASAELKAALAFAKRRRLGPFRDKKADPDRQRKDLAAMARGGFSLDVARKALNAESFEDSDDDYVCGP